MTSYEFSSFFILIFLIIVLIYINERYNNVVVKIINDIIYEIEKFFRDYNKQNPECFSKTCIPYFKSKEDCLDPPSLDKCEDIKDSKKYSQNVINITCGGTSNLTDKSCITPKCIEPNDECKDLCKNSNKIQFGCYCYIISYLPGIIYKYALDNNKAVIEESKVDIIHTLGTLKRIFIDKDIIYVEDSNSIIHSATFNPLNGDLTF